MSNSERFQQIVPAAVMLVIAGAICWISFTAEPSGAFLFPRLISSALVLFAALTFLSSLAGTAPPIPGFTWHMLANVIPGIIVILVAVFWAASSVGFYTTALVSFFLLASYYDPSGDWSWRRWLFRGVVSLCFVLVLYGLFALLLRVQTPSGWLL